MTAPPVAAALALLSAAALAACGPRDDLVDHKCPPDSTLTWDNFAGGFFDEWCQRCHGAPDGSRNGAPDQYNFDSRDAVELHASLVYDMAAGANNAMPPGPNGPPSEQREELADWLACGAP